MRLRLGHTARRIDVADQTVTATADTGDEQVFGYDALIVGTGAAPVVPPMDGLDQLGPEHGLHLLHTIGDTHTLAATLDRGPRSAVIVGAGYEVSARLEGKPYRLVIEGEDETAAAAS